MLQILDKIMTSKEKKLAATLIVIFLISRLWNLTLLPIFTDEAIYIRWAEIAWSIRSLDNAKTLVFIPLTDGKQPLFMWIGGFFMQFIPDHLWAGRFPSVISGLFSMIGLWLLSRELFKDKKIAWISSLIYLILPFTYLYDRMALADSMLAMSGIWATYLSLIFINNPNFKNSVLLGLIYGFGLLVKSPAIFFYLLTPMTLLFAPFLPDGNNIYLNLKNYYFWKWPKTTWQTFGKWLGLYIFAVIIGQIIQAVQRISGLYQRIAEKNLEFLITKQDFFAHPFSLTYGNLYGMTVWFIGYIGLPLIFCAIVAILIGIKRLDKRIIYLLFLLTVPWLASASMAKVLYPRYLLYFTPPLLLLISYGFYLLIRLIQKIPFSLNIQKSLIILVVVLFFGLSVNFTYLLLTDPSKAPLPLQDREQYVSGWPSGYGVNQINSYLRDVLKNEGKIAVGTEGTFGLMPFALEIEFYKEIYDPKYREQKDINEKPVYIEGIYPFNYVPQSIIEFAARRPTFFLIYQNEEKLLQQCPLELVKSITKPGNKATIRLYKVIAQERYAEIRCIKY